jgi:toxin ParE1/3/4
MISQQAEEDLRAIYAYIAFELQSPQNALRQLRRLEEEIRSLDQMPERFQVYKSEPWRSRNLRIMPVNNYLVFYIPDPTTRNVHIIRIMHGTRDIASQLDID